MNNQFRNWPLALLLLFALGCTENEPEEVIEPVAETPVSLVTTERFDPNDDFATGGVQLHIGADANNNGALDADEIVSSHAIPNGSGGTQVVVDLTELTGTGDCAEGGFLLRVGLDTNGDEVLNEEEVSGTNFICHGEAFALDLEEWKLLVDWGDSLTAGVGSRGGATMSKVAAERLGPGWEVVNMGIGGENTLTIGARQGGMPMYIKEPIVIPADGSKVVLPITTDEDGREVFGLFSTHNDAPVRPLLQGARGLRPIYIQGKECGLSRNSTTGTYAVWQRGEGDDDIVTGANEVITSSGSLLTDGFANFFVGQNGGYRGPEEFAAQLDKFVEHKGDDRFLIVTSHGNGYQGIIEPVLEKYGRRVIDFRTYMSTRAIDDAIALGLLPDDGSVPTAEDLEDMRHGNAPTSLRVDNVHLNAVGYELLGRLRYERGEELGYW